MNQLLTDLKNNLLFVLVSAAIAAALILIARLSERFLPQFRKVKKARYLTIVSVCSAIAAILHILDFPLPFLAPGFYKLDLSELPVMLCGFYLGPTGAVVCEAVKILLKLLLKGTSTAFVGDFANFVVGCSLVLPASVIYHIRRTRTTAILGLCLGTAILTVFGSLFNAVYLIPKFSQLFGLPLASIIEMGNMINGGINDLTTFVLFAVVPLNLIKGAGISVLTMLLYKRIARPLFSK